MTQRRGTRVVRAAAAIGAAGVIAVACGGSLPVGSNANHDGGAGAGAGGAGASGGNGTAGQDAGADTSTGGSATGGTGGGTGGSATGGTGTGGAGAGGIGGTAGTSSGGTSGAGGGAGTTGSGGSGGCAAGMTTCSGTCVDLQTDKHHCGDCAHDCTTLANVVPSGTTCANGSCLPKCDLLHGDCDGNPDNGCETDTTTNTRCGSCTTSCTGPTQCGLSNGVYKCLTCEDRGLTTCGTGASAKCVDTSSDPNNCGACGLVCPNGKCAGGYCTECQISVLQEFNTSSFTFGNKTCNFPLKCPNMNPSATIDALATGTMSSTPSASGLWDILYLRDPSTGQSSASVNYSNGGSSYNYAVPFNNVSVAAGGTVSIEMCDNGCSNNTTANCDLVLSGASMMKIWAQ